MPVHGQRARGAIVAADQRVGVAAGIDHHAQAELMGQVHRVRTLQEDGVDIAPQQADQLIVAAAEAAGVQAHFSAVQVLLGIIAVGAAVGVVDQLHIGHRQAFELQGVFQPAQGLGTGEVDLYVGPLGYAETAVLQVANAAYAAFFGGEDQLHLITPRQPQHAGLDAAGVGPDGRDVTAVAHRVLQVMVVVGFAHLAFAGLAQRLDIGAKRRKGLGQPPRLHGDAEAGGHGAVGVPERFQGLGHGVTGFLSIWRGASSWSSGWRVIQSRTSKRAGMKRQRLRNSTKSCKASMACSSRRVLRRRWASVP